MGGHKRRKNHSRKKREPTRPPFGGIELKWPPLAFTLNHLRDKVRRIVQQRFPKETTTEQSRKTEQGKNTLKIQHVSKYMLKYKASAFKRKGNLNLQVIP